MESLTKDVMLFLKELTTYKYFLPVAHVIGGFLIGCAIEVILIRQLARLVKKTRYKFDDFVIRAFRRMGILWFTLAGVYYAVEGLTIKHKYVVTINKALLILVIISMTIVLARVSVGFISFYLKRVGYPSTTLFTNLSYIIILIVGGLVALAALDISITPILTALGVGGLAAALALQDTLSNLFAGIQIIASKKIKPGDYVRLETGGEGHITDINWRNAVVRTLTNTVVIVPNSRLSTTVITNLSRPVQEMSLIVPVGVSYTSDLAKVERVSIEVAALVMKEVPGGVEKFQPLVRFTQLSEYSINFNVILRVHQYTDQYLVIHEFIKRLFERFAAEGIEIPFPTQTLYLSDTDHNKK
ncbi:MAG: mechanosensitive ion channel family protein [Deltaproteobacteria bacterium]|nr:mechanosensitive ion channel family protein [Candidatus Zymogenaceae bacterium]